jgi:hypothetical protein
MVHTEVLVNPLQKRPPGVQGELRPPQQVGRAIGFSDQWLGQ